MSIRQPKCGSDKKSEAHLSTRKGVGSNPNPLRFFIFQLPHLETIVNKWDSVYVWVVLKKQHTIKSTAVLFMVCMIIT